MFTGLVADLGTVTTTDRIGNGDGLRLTIATTLASELKEGDSIAVNGVCLTATKIQPNQFSADVMRETLDRTSLGSDNGNTNISPARVNLELALRVSDRLGGHIVQGHVDGLGEVTNVEQEGFSRRITIACDPGLLRYIVEKGSITVDGVSLTVAAVDGEGFTVALIPKTLEATTLGSLHPGERVNLEVDLLAKYVEKLQGVNAR